MARLERSSVSIATAQGKRSVEAFVDPEIPGLAVTKLLTWSGKAVYTVTHVRSGYGFLVRGVTKDVAVKVLRFLGKAAREQGFSWDVSRSKLMETSKRRALEAIQEAWKLVPARDLAKVIDETEAEWTDEEVSAE
ncbi:MAG: hypothetical protein ACM3X3_08990 [Betaproteobacteria bacterium]